MISDGSSPTTLGSSGSESFTINLPGGKKTTPPFGFDSAAAIAAFIASLSDILSLATALNGLSVTS